MRYVVWGMIVALLIAHQDNFLGNNDTLVWGFMPIGLAYHAGISLIAGFVWYLATRFCWPGDSGTGPLNGGDSANGGEGA